MSSPRFSSMSNPTTDRISALPDPILCHVLSFLPTKLASSTSILSKRWRSLWLSVLTLDFDDQGFADFSHFLHFVYSVMLSRNLTLPLRSFRLKCGHCSRFDQHDINRFVNRAVQSGIENLKLDMSSAIKLPPSALNCRTLTVLKLKMLTVNVLPYVDFPLLKTLCLDLVTFKCHKFLINLLSGCPILEDLQTKCLRVIEFPGLHWGRSSEGKVKSLASLVRANISNLHIPLTLLYNAEFLRVELSFLYLPHDPAFCNLTKIELIFASKRSQSHVKWKWLVELFKHCPKLKNLTLHEDCTYEKSYGDWTEPRFVPECLSSELRTCLIKDYKGTECELQFAKYIMHNSKVLDTMAIQCTNSIDINAKHEMLMKLSLCSRGSVTCKLIFD